jgi:signal transduction histidine kinase
VAAPPFPIPSDEAERLTALHRYDVLNGTPLPDLNSIVELAAYLVGVPTAVINMIDENTQNQIAAVGFKGLITPRQDSMCAVTIVEPEPVVLPDASADVRFKDNPWVNGKIADVRFYASNQLREPGGHVLGTLCVFDSEVRDLSPAQEQALEKLSRMVVDVLELRRHTELVREALAEVRATSEELARSNAALEEFAGQVSHDLKNPLTGVLGFVATLADMPVVMADPGARMCADRAMSSATRMWRTIDDVLSHASAGAAPYLTTVPLEDTAAHVIDDVEAAIRSAGASVTVGRLPTVLGDPTQLRVLLQNVVSNALKFRDPSRPCRIEITAQETDDSWVLRVVDNGIGIAPEDRGRVLEMFTRLRPDIQGSGIGLATVRRIVTAHHAELAIEETPGGGTTISVSLPRRRQAVAPELATARH